MFQSNHLVGFGAGGGLVTTQIAQGTGTVIGDMTGGGGIAAAFNGTDTAAAASCASLSNVASGYVGKDWGVGNSHIISRCTVYASSNQGFNNDLGTGLRLRLQGSTDNFSSSIVDLGSLTFAGDASTPENSANHDLTITDTSTAYRYHRVIYDRNGAGNVWPVCSEIKFYEDI